MTDQGNSDEGSSHNDVLDSCKENDRSKLPLTRRKTLASLLGVPGLGVLERAQSREAQTIRTTPDTLSSVIDITPDDAAFYDDFEGSDTPLADWQVTRDEGTFDARVVDQPSPADQEKALSVTETVGGATAGVINWADGVPGWDSEWTLSGLFRTTAVSTGVRFQAHAVRLYRTPTGDEGGLSVVLGFTQGDGSVREFQIRGDLVDEITESYDPGWQEGTWYNYEVSHDGDGKYTGRLWEVGESRPANPQAESQGAPPGTDARVAGILINGARSEPLEMRHDFMQFEANFGVSVEIERTNAPVSAGETLKVGVRVENLNEETGVLTVSLDTDGLTDIVPGTTFRLDSEGEVATETFEIETEPDDRGSYALVAEGEGDPGEDTDSETVSVSTERLIVDETAREDDPEYQTIQNALADAEADDVIDVLDGTYQGPVVIDKTVTIETSENAVVEAGTGEDTEFFPAAFLVDSDDTPDVAPTIRGFTIRAGDSGRALRFSGVDGDWTAEDLTIDGDGTLIDARSTGGQWTIGNVTVDTDASPLQTVDATGASGDWRIEDSDLAGSTPVDAEETIGDWRIENCTVTADSDAGSAINARASKGDWQINGTDVETAAEAIRAQEATGDWEVEGPADITGASVGVNANDADGTWAVNLVNFREMAGDDDIHVTAIGVTDPPGNARRNYYEDTAPDVRGSADQNNVDARNPLAAPASIDATVIAVDVENAIAAEVDCPGSGDGTCDIENAEPQPGAEVALFDLSAITFGIDVSDSRANRLIDPIESFEDLLDEIDGQDILFNQTILEAATRRVETGRDGLVWYNGLDPDTNYGVVVVPPRDSTGSVRSRQPPVSAETTTFDTITFTDQTHFDYLRDGYFGDDPLSVVQSALVDKHLDDLANALEAAHDDAGALTRDLRTSNVEKGDVAINQVGGALLEETTEAIREGRAWNPQKLKKNIAQAAAVGAFHLAVGYFGDSWGLSVAGWSRKRVERAAADRRGELADQYEAYGEELSEREWIVAPNENDAGDYRSLPTIEGVPGRVRGTVETIDSIRERGPDGSVDVRPPAELNHEHVRAVFRDFKGLVDIPGDPPDDSEQVVRPRIPSVVVTPDGRVYDLFKSGEQFRRIQQIADELTSRDELDLMGDVFGALGTLGIVIALVPGGQVAGATISAVATAGSAATALLSEVQDVGLENQLAGEYIKFHLDALRDADELALVFEEYADWLATQYEDPITGTVDGEISSVPDIGPVSPDGDEPRRASVDIGYKNTGEETVPARVVGRFSYVAGTDPDADFVAGTQPYVSTGPDKGDPAPQLAPGESLTTETPLQYVVPDNLGQLNLRVVLYLGGKRVDRSFQEVSVADGSVAADGPQSGDDLQRWGNGLTAAQQDSLRIDSTSLAGETLAPGETVETSVTPSTDDTEAASIRVETVPNADVVVSVTDSTGTELAEGATAGEFVSVPLGESVDVRVTVAPTARSALPVSVLAYELPTRPAVLRATPGRVSVTAAPGTTVAPRLGLAEIGGQVAVENPVVESGELTNAAGTALSTTPTVEVGDGPIAPGDNRAGRLSVAVPAASELGDLSGEPTRFEGEVTVSSTTADDVPVFVSALVLDTTLDAALDDADDDVTAVRLTETTPPAEPPLGEAVAAYELTVEGNGEASVRLPTDLRHGETEVVQYVDGAYETLAFVATDERGRVTVPAGEHTVVATDLPAGLARYTDEDGVVRTEGLREAISDWRAGEIDTDLLREAIGAWRSGEPVV